MYKNCSFIISKKVNADHDQLGVRQRDLEFFTVFCYKNGRCIVDSRRSYLNMKTWINYYNKNNEVYLSSLESNKIK